jgi:NAD/NADP transhydrogenase beta subunit
LSDLPLSTTLSTSLGLLIGGITFSGSLVAGAAGRVIPAGRSLFAGDAR